MCSKGELSRKVAVERYLVGESVSAICISLERSRNWFYKWLNRYKQGGENWFKDRSRSPHHHPRKTSNDVEVMVLTARRELDEQGLFCGAQAILWELEDRGVEPLPSESTAGRILRRHGLVQRRAGRYQSKGKKYPALSAKHPNDVHAYDFVGPCYITGGLRFYSLNVLDIATRRCGLEAMTSKKDVYRSVYDIWKRLGLPKYAQFDNAMEFYGSPAHPRGMGQVIRLCLHHKVEPVFIPVREPWRNGAIEKFNDHWENKFYGRVPLRDEEDLDLESLRFEHRHNSRWRYSPLGGKTPMQSLEASKRKIDFPVPLRSGRLPKPKSGQYHLVRFIRSDRLLDVFGEKFLMPAKAVYEYVQATIDVGREKLTVRLDRGRIEELDYPSH
jgi:putative transposase